MSESNAEDVEARLAALLTFGGDPESRLFEIVELWRETGRRPDLGQVSELLMVLGRAYGPFALWYLFTSGLLTHVAAVVNVGDVWSACEFPQRSIDAEAWRTLFGFAGYTDEGHLAFRPDEPLTLYRGAPMGRERGWSWSASEEVATRFICVRERQHEHLRGARHGCLWRAEVEPWRLYAHNIGAEDEYVIDTRHGMAVVEVEITAAALTEARNPSNPRAAALAVVFPPRD